MLVSSSSEYLRSNRPGIITERGGLVYLGAPKTFSTSLYEFLPRYTNNFRTAIKEWNCLNRLGLGMEVDEILSRRINSGAYYSFGRHLVELTSYSRDVSRISEIAATELVHSAHILFAVDRIETYCKTFEMCPPDMYFTDMSVSNLSIDAEHIAHLADIAPNLTFVAVDRDFDEQIRSAVVHYARIWGGLATGHAQPRAMDADVFRDIIGKTIEGCLQRVEMVDGIPFFSFFRRVVDQKTKLLSLEDRLGDRMYRVEATDLAQNPQGFLTELAKRCAWMRTTAACPEADIVFPKSPMNASSAEQIAAFDEHPRSHDVLEFLTKLSDEAGRSR